MLPKDPDQLEWLVNIETSLNQPVLEPKINYGQFRGMARFVRLPLQRIVWRGPKNWPVFRENWFSEGPV
jgi:hypothetical protein